LLKTAIRAAITVGSTFTPIGPAILYTTAAIEFAKAVPMLGKMVNGFISDEQSELLNRWDNNARMLSIGMSEEAMRDGFWSMENIINMAADSYMQLGQQRAIAELPSKLIGTKKKTDILFKAAEREAATNLAFGRASGAETAMRMAKSFNDAEKLLRTTSKISDVVSKVYLTTTAMQDTFNTARRYGFDQETSSWITLLSMGGMFALLQTDYFRGMLANNMDYELKRELKQVVNAFVNTMDEPFKKAGIPMATAVATASPEAKVGFLKSIGKKAKNFFTNHINNVSSGTFEGFKGIGHGMLAEGVEETMEEIMQDSAIALVRGMKTLGATITGKEYSDSYNWRDTDPWARYSASFFGGMIGGGIFKTADLLHFKKGAYEQFSKMLTDHKQLGNRIIEYVADGHVNEVRKAFKEIQESGLPFVDQNLSALTLKPTNNVNETISTVTFSNIDSALVAMDSFIKSNGLNYNREDAEKVKYGQSLRAGWLKDNSMTEIIYQDYLSEMSKLISLDANKETLIKSMDGKSDEEKEKIRAQIKPIDDLIKKKIEDVKEIMSGNKDRYPGMIMLKANRTSILDPIVPMTKEALAKHRYTTEFSELPQAYQKEIEDAIKDMEKGGFAELNLSKA
jgi:hypothetical protein